MNNLLKLIPLLAILFFSGCSTSSFNSNVKNSEIINHQIEKLKNREDGIAMHDPYNFRLKPLIGSRNLDARTVVDMGTPIKIWIAPYKSNAGILVSQHDIYIWGRRPNFITGEELPRNIRKNSGITYKNKLPFSLSPEEVDRGDINSDENIEKFISNLPTEGKAQEPINNPSVLEIDKKIKEFIKNQKEIQNKEIK